MWAFFGHADRWDEPTRLGSQKRNHLYFRFCQRTALSVRANLLVGMFAGACTQLISCPFKTLAVQMQAGNYNSTIDACRGIYYSSTGGSFKNFYHGLNFRLILK